MGRYKEAPFGFACPYEHACPHLGGISATWARCLIEDAQRDGFRDGHLARDAEAELAALSADVARLEKENAELRARLQAQHRSRFKPRRKPEPAEAPAEGGRKRGPPFGHPPWSRRAPDHVDRTVHVPAPATCPHCQCAALVGSPQLHEQLQEDIVLTPRTHVTRYVHAMAWCPDCRRTVFQTADGELRNCQIGPRTKATAVFLRHTLKLSFRDTRAIFSQLFGMPFVPASAMAFGHAAARAAEPLHETLRDKVRNADIVHGDETGWRLEGKPAHLWYAGTPDFAFFHIDPSRSGDVAAAIFGSAFRGGLVADDYAAYNAIHPVHRQACLAHLSRRAKEILETVALLPPERQSAAVLAFCRDLRVLLSDACELGRQRDAGLLGFLDARACIPGLYDRLHVLCANPLPLAEAETLRQRLLDPKRDYHRLFVFLQINHMPPTNNHAEQSLRWPVIFRKIVFGNRSETGAHAFSVNHSVILTAQRQHLDPLPILQSLLLNGHLHPASRIFNDSS